jgi:hypothetical protein
LYRTGSFTTTNNISTKQITGVDRPGIFWHEEYTRPFELKPITARQWVDASLDVNTKGKPEVYWIQKQSVSSQENQFTVKMFPTPDSSSYTIYYDYYANVTDMSGNSDIPTFPKEFDELIILIATYMGKKFQEKPQLASIERADVQALFSSLKKWDDTLVNNFGNLRKRTIGRTRNALATINTPITV